MLLKELFSKLNNILSSKQIGESALPSDYRTFGQFHFSVFLMDLIYDRF